MAETYPGHSSEFDFDDAGGKKESSKGGGSKRSFERPTIKKVGGETPLKFGEALRPRPLGESFKPEQTSGDDSLEKARTERLSGKSEPAESENWHRVSAEELHAKAAKAAAEQLMHHEAIQRSQTEQDKSEKSKEESADSTSGHKPKNYRGNPKTDHLHRLSKEEWQPLIEGSQWLKDVGISDVGDQPSEQVAEQPKSSKGEAAELTGIMSDMPKEFMEASSGEELKETAEQHIGPEAEQTPHQTSEANAAFAGIVGAPELADLAAKQLPETPGLPLDEQSKAEAFDEWVQSEHPELNTPEMAAASNSDEGFNDIVRHNFGDQADGGPAQYREQAPGSPPNYTGNTTGNGGGANRPPTPHTASGGGGHNGPPQSPNFGGSNPNAANPNVNPNVLNNPWATAGNVLHPAPWMAYSALAARQELNSLKHTAREIGLAGAIGVLGIGLLAERRKRRKDVRKLNKNLEQTNKALQKEQFEHQHTRHNLEGSAAAQAARHEQIRRPQEQHLPKGEVIGTGLISAAAAAELAAKAGHTHEAPQSRSAADRELAHRLKHSRELGRAIKRNPELQDAAEVAAVGAAGEAAALQRETRHEILRSQYSDAEGQPRSSGGADPVTHDRPSLPQPQPTAFSMMSGSAPEQMQPTGKPSARSKLAKPWVWATIGVILAIGLIVFFAA
jgi:hypothetical protein